MRVLNLELELGGIETDRFMQAGVSHVPEHMELTEDAIVWAGPFRDVRPRPGLLEDFLQLDDTNKELDESKKTKIFRYAQRWGVLGICQHHLPACHNHQPFGAQWGLEACEPLPAERGEFWHTDPLEYWQSFSRLFRSLRDLGAQVNQGKVGDDSQWRLVHTVREEDPPWKNIREARTVLSWKLQDLLDIGQVRPHVKWDSRKQQWQIEMAVHSVPNLFGLLSLSLVLSICQRELAICSSCQQPYIPARRPNPTRRNYCQRCGNAAAQRDAARDYRLRSKEAQ